MHLKSPVNAGVFYLCYKKSNRQHIGGCDMPRYSPTHNSSLKFDMPKDLRDRFIAACEKKNLSQSEVLRLIMEAWAETVEEKS